MLICYRRLYFNPRSYKRSDILSCFSRSFRFISIHAPTRGATSAHAGIILAVHISIHAPTRGATTSFIRLQFRTLFQSTLLQEERLCFCSYKTPLLLFQSTLLQEERRSAMQCIFSIQNFNPRSYKRSDLCYFKDIKRILNFNPRSYKRSDSGFLEPLK